MPYSYSIVSPTWASVSTIDGRGRVVINHADVPDLTQSYTVIVRATDGAATEDISVVVNFASAPAVAVEYTETQIVEIGGATAGIEAIDVAGATILPADDIEIGNDLLAGIEVIDEITVVTIDRTVDIGQSSGVGADGLGTFEATVDIGQFSEVDTDGAGVFEATVDIGQSVNDSATGGSAVASTDLAQSSAITVEGLGIYDRALSLAQSTDSEAVPDTGGAISQSIVTTGLTFAQSSKFGSLADASQANMTDLNGTTGSATNNGANEWIEVSFTSQTIRGVRLGGGSIPGWGGVQTYLNGANIQYWDGGAWVTITAVADYTDSGANQFRELYFPPVATAQLRIQRSGYLATTEFAVIEVTGATAEADITTGLTFAQSSKFGSLQDASQANMTDTNGTTGSATNNGANEWIEVSFTSATIGGVRLGGGSIPGWGGVQSYLNGANLQYWDGAAWVQIQVVSGYTDSGANQFAELRFGIVATDRLRIQRSGYLATTEFVPIELL